MSWIEGWPISWPAASKKTFPTTPTMITRSAVPRSRTFFATAIESSTFVPPRTKVTGRGASEKTRERFATSFSIRRPATDGSRSGIPTIEG